MSESKLNITSYKQGTNRIDVFSFVNGANDRRYETADVTSRSEADSQIKLGGSCKSNRTIRMRENTKWPKWNLIVRKGERKKIKEVPSSR